VGRSRGGFTTKIHARVDAKGRPVSLLISPGEAHDVTYAEALLERLEPCAVVIADKAYDADRVRAQIRAQGAIPNIPSRSHRRRKFRWTKAFYRERNHIERFFNKLKQNRRIATRYDKLGATFFAFVKLAAVRIWLRSIESTAFCNGPGDVKSPRVIVTPPSSRFCPWSASRPPHYAVKRNGEPI
jgi:transposase